MYIKQTPHLFPVPTENWCTCGLLDICDACVHTCAHACTHLHRDMYTPTCTHTCTRRDTHSKFSFPIVFSTKSGFYDSLTPHFRYLNLTGHVTRRYQCVGWTTSFLGCSVSFMNTPRCVHLCCLLCCDSSSSHWLPNANDATTHLFHTLLHIHAGISLKLIHDLKGWTGQVRMTCSLHCKWILPKVRARVSMKPRVWISSIRQPWKFLVPEGVPQTVHIHQPQMIMLWGAPRCHNFLCTLGEGDIILWHLGNLNHQYMVKVMNFQPSPRSAHTHGVFAGRLPLLPWGGSFK